MMNVYKVFIAVIGIMYLTTIPICAESIQTRTMLNLKMSTTVTPQESTNSDNVKPRLSAVINSGVLSIQGTDTGSGIATISVNSYDYSNLENGLLNIQLQQFDTGYPYFTLQAKDVSGNVSDVYKLKNPYYLDPSLEKEKRDAIAKLVETLPETAIATSPVDAKGTIISHTQMIPTPTQTTGSSASVPVMAAVQSEVVKSNESAGKEFYTIQTASDKVFYLIIDKSQKENNVYLLTEVSENDLLNFSESTAAVLPQNAAVVESAVPNNSSLETSEASGNSQVVSDANTESIASTNGSDNGNNTDTAKTPKKPTNTGNYIMIAIVIVVVGGFGAYTKLIKNKKESYDEDEYEEDEEETESVEDEDANEVTETEDEELT